MATTTIRDEDMYIFHRIERNLSLVMNRLSEIDNDTDNTRTDVAQERLRRAMDDIKRVERSLFGADTAEYFPIITSNVIREEIDDCKRMDELIRTNRLYRMYYQGVTNEAEEEKKLRRQHGGLFVRRGGRFQS